MEAKKYLPKYTELLLTQDMPPLFQQIFVKEIDGTQSAVSEQYDAR